MPQLTWLGDSNARRAARRVPYRILNPAETVGDPTAENLLVQGDNLEALKALLPFYAGRVKCIYIDPPYNTQSAFEPYDDNLEHSQWLSMMYPRLDLLHELLSEDGSCWVQLDDNEAQYARVMLDEIFKRENFVGDIIWQKSYAVRSHAEFVSASTEHLLWYAKHRSTFSPNKLRRSAVQRSRFSNPDGDPRGPWQSITFTISLVSGARGRQFARTGTSPNIYEVVSPAGVPFNPPPGRCWARAPGGFEELSRDGRIWWGPKGDRVPRLKMFLSEAEDAVIPTTLWASGEEYGFNQDGVREIRNLGLEFPSPKPERLIQNVLMIGSNPGDIVLDSFLGSGTTAAVAHKMGRRWIGIEMGEHAASHCVPRLKKVIDGEQGGISETVGWKGGGGFRFMKLGTKAFFDDGALNTDIKFKDLATYLWFVEARAPHPTGKFKTPLLGIHGGIAYVLLYNGIIGDRRPETGNVLTAALWNDLRKTLPRDRTAAVVYGEACRLSAARLRELKVTFKQIPYDVGMR